MSKCWYCGKEIKNENNKEHIGICDKCYQESFEVGNKFVSNLIEKQTEKDQKIADLEAKIARTQNELSAKVEYINELVVVKDNYKKQLTLTEKALELSCKNEFILNAYPRITDEEGYVVHRFHYYIKQAKEIMKNE